MRNPILVFDKPQVAYFSIAKTGSTTVKEALWETFGRREDERLSSDLLPHEIRRRLVGYKCFALVRNPYDRAASMYTGVIERPDRRNHQKAKPREEYVFGAKSFEDFLARMRVRVREDTIDQHFRTQSATLPQVTVQKCKVAVIKLEDPDVEAKISEQIAHPFSFGEERNTSEGHTVAWNDDAIRQVRMLYGVDFARFGYAYDR